MRRMLQIVLRPLIRWAWNIGRDDVVIHIHRVEIALDDPEKFMRGLVEAAERTVTHVARPRGHIN